MRFPRRFGGVAVVAFCFALVVTACRDYAIVGPSVGSASDLATTMASGSACQKTRSLSPTVAGDVMLSSDGTFEEVTSDEPVGDEVYSGNSYCDQEYARLIAGCRKLPKKVDRAICYSAAMVWYADCLYPTSRSCGGPSEMTCDDGGTGGGGGGGGDGGGGGGYCHYEKWEISYDGGYTWEDWGNIWTCADQT